jgi:integrase
MPKRAQELSALQVNRLRDEGLHAVGGVPGLYLQVRGDGRSWILRAMVGAKRRDMGLGPFPIVPLALARERARQARQTLASGADPILVRQQQRNALRASQARALTFSEACSQFIDAKAPEWRNEKHRQQWTNSLAMHAEPVLGSLHVGDITQAHVLRVLEPIWVTKTETASRLRGRIEQVLDWARVRGFREGDNPARWRGHLDKLLANPSRIVTVEHHPAVPIDQVPAFTAELRAREGLGARALEMVLLTAARSGEVRGATWSEIDLDAALWVIPARRMKGNREHRVPLSAPVLALLKALPRFEGCDLLFASRGEKPLSDMTLTAVMRRMNVDAVPHGLRSSFRDWISERTNFPPEMAEMALAHRIADQTEAAYRRGDMLAKRAAMMTAWAEFCGS